MFLLGAPEALNTIYVVTDLKAVSEVKDPAGIHRGGSRGRVQAVRTPPEMSCGFLIQLVFCQKKTMWFIGVEVEPETSAPPPKKNPCKPTKMK